MFSALISFSRAAGVLALATAAAGCSDDDCAHELHASVRYKGTIAGTFYSRTVVDGRAIGGGSGPSDGGANGSAGGSSEACFGAGAKGGYVEGWVDLDGDDSTRCTCAAPPLCGVLDPSCEPESGDPQIKKEFTFEGELTEVSAEFGGS